MHIISSTDLFEAYLHWVHLFCSCHGICFSDVHIFFDAEARIDLGKSAIDKEVVEKVGYTFLGL
jgi:hypothetical protein